MITSNTTHASNQSMLKRVPYDAVADFEPVSKLGTITLALVGHPSVPANNVQELIAYAKANPGKLTFGAGSTSSRVAGELMKIMAGIDMLHVPYRSNPLVVTDLLGGQISLFFGDVSTSLPPVRAGKLKGFAVSSLKRSQLAPDLPPLDEAGLKGYDLTAWFAAYAPAEDAEAGDRCAQRRHPQGAGRSGADAQAAGGRHRAGRKLARRAQDLHDRRDREVAEKSWPTPRSSRNRGRNIFRRLSIGAASSVMVSTERHASVATKGPPPCNTSF